MTPADALQMALDLYATGLDVMRQNLRRRHPGKSDEDVNALLQQWLKDRPGAASGDCPGPRIDIDRTVA